VLAAALGEAAPGEAAPDDHLETFKRRYLSLLAEEISRKPNAYRPVAGAQVALRRLADDAGWMTAIATGNWRQAAALKLECAGVDIGPSPGAFSEDAETRVGVIEAAVARARACAPGPIEHVVYVGDQLWDMTAAALAGVAFVGIGSNRGDVLRAAGARVVRDYVVSGELVDALEEAVGRDDARSNAG
jgi:phosphoglycolate phosphatase-like HAD superfamily hydrolase